MHGPTGGQDDELKLPGSCKRRQGGVDCGVGNQHGWRGSVLGLASRNLRSYGGARWRQTDKSTELKHGQLDSVDN